MRPFLSALDDWMSRGYLFQVPAALISLHIRLYLELQALLFFSSLSGLFCFETDIPWATLQLASKPGWP